jgi:hypothetical protein
MKYGTKEFKELIMKIPYVSVGRVPFTYHHDKIRVALGNPAGISRSDVARAVGEYEKDDPRLYATALVSVLEEINGLTLLELLEAGLEDERSVEIIKEARALFARHLDEDMKPYFA